MLIQHLLGLAIGATQASAAAVFAHFMVRPVTPHAGNAANPPLQVGNTESYTIDTWRDEIRLAQAAHVDAFALNIAKDEPVNRPQLSNAFSAANALGFKLFFSFDYAGRGPWDKGAVTSLLREYGPNGAYYREDGKPLVSTFEGVANAADWRDIKRDIGGALFVPDWSSVGAWPAYDIGKGIIDGLFSWGAWLDVDNAMGGVDTYTDASYKFSLERDASAKLPYMMPVSPWFYTNLPGYDKNWLWASDTLWFDRWHQVLVMKPRWVQIISWNDYGESHYIGPIRDGALGAFTSGRAPFNYARDVPHDAWRAFLPHVIDLYKSGRPTITREGVTAWYRLQPLNGGCSDADTTTNTATHLQREHSAAEGTKDGVFFAALLGSPADVEVTIGGQTVAAKWTWSPPDNVGVFRGQALSSATGAVRVTIRRGGNVIATIVGDKSIGGCTEGRFINFNPVVQTGWSTATISATPPLAVGNMVCVEGTGKGDYKELCDFSCRYGYCPEGSCVCSKLGRAQTPNTPRGERGYARFDPGFDGLCAFSCSYNVCPNQFCDRVRHDNLQSPPVSPFIPAACRAGTGDGRIAPLCEFGCRYGWCPIKAGCRCTETGALRQFPAETGQKPQLSSDNLAIRLLCGFACKLGYCRPDGICNN